MPILRIGFIGGGQMATALSMGMIKSGILADNSSIIISDPYKNQLNKITKTFKSLNIKNIKFETTTNNKQCIKNCNIVFIAVKPQYISSVMNELNPFWVGNEIIVSMVTGIKLKALQTKLTDKTKQPIIRIMPNTPSLVGAGAIGMTKGVSIISDIYPCTQWIDYI